MNRFPLPHSFPLPKACNPFLRIIFLVLLLLSALYPLASQATEPRTYVISGDFNYPPYEYLDENQQPHGYNVELSRAIEKILKVKFEIRLMKWSQARKSLETGEVDLLQGMALTAERAKTLHFSIPHIQTWRSIFVTKNSKIKTIEDIVNATLIMQQGDVSNEFLGVIGFKGSVVECPTQTDALRLLNRGLYDATIINHIHGMYLTELHQFDNITVLSDQVQSRDYCYASKDEELISMINKALVHLGRTGELKHLQDKWFKAYSPKIEPASLLDPYYLPWVIPALLTLLGLILYSVFLRRRMKTQKRELLSQIDVIKARETELRQERDLFRYGPVVVYKLVLEPLRMLYVSPNVEQFGYQPAQILELENALFSLVHTDDLPNLIASKARLDKDNPAPNESNYRIIDTDGVYHWIYDYSLYVKDGSGSLLSYGYLIDNSHNKELEDHLLEAKLKAEEANLTKGQYLANMSHEIRNPLNGILGLISLLDEMEKTPEQKEIFDLIDASGRSLNSLIIDILDLSKIESGQLQTMFSSFKPRYLVEDLINTYARQRERAGVDVRLQISDDLPEIVWGDQMRTRQILTNLMQNALKFTSEGWVQLSASLYARTGDTVRIHFCVQDTGIGIPSQHHEQIFDLYFQGNNHSKGRAGGTGLGLPIVKRLVSLLGGIIWLESEPGKGSSFHIILPYSLNLTDTDGLDTVSANDHELQHLPALKVLIVDSDAVSGKIIKNQLGSWGLTVDLAESGAKAVEMCSNQLYDFILIDLQIPDIDGITAAATILANHNPEHQKPFICGVSASKRPLERDAVLSAGLNELIYKPINLRSLHQILSKIDTANKGDDHV